MLVVSMVCRRMYTTIMHRLHEELVAWMILLARNHARLRNALKGQRNEQEARQQKSPGEPGQSYLKHEIKVSVSAIP